MASIKISELAAVTSVTNDDVLIVNDGDVNTRKITYQNLTSNLVSTGGGQTINGDLTITGTLNTQGLVVDSDLITVDTVNNRIGVVSQTPACTLDVGGPIQARDGAAIRMADADTSAFVSLQSPAVLAQNTPYTLPGAYPTQANQLLGCDTSGAMSWITGLIDPMTTVGDIVVRDISNQTARLPVGSTGQVLTAQADGTTAWQNNTAGFADPMTTAGDIIIRNSSNITTRLGVGTAGQALSVTAGGEIAWLNPVAGAAGGNLQIQFNDNGVLGADGDFVYDNVNDRLQAPNIDVVSDLVVNRNASFGDTATDLIAINGSITTALVPNNSGNLALGSQTNRWGDIWAGSQISFFEGGATGLISFDNLEGYIFSGLGVGNTTGRLTIQDEQNNNSVTLAAPTSANLAASYTLTFPNDVGNSGQSLILADNNGTLTWGNPSGTGLSTRTTANVTTANIADQANDDVEITTNAPSLMLQRIEVDQACWVRVYTSDAARTADAGRVITTDPAPGSGVLAEIVTTGAAIEAMTPGTTCYFDADAAGTRSNDAFIAVQNLSGGATAITVTLTYVALEAQV